MIVKIFRKIRAVSWRLAVKFHRLSAKYQAWLAGGNLEIGTGVAFVTPVRVDGRGKVTVGDHCSIGYRLAPRFGNGETLLQAREPAAVVSVGEGSHFSNNVTIVARTRIDIGGRCAVGDRVTILDSDFHELDPETRKNAGGAGMTAPVTIGENCWIGSEVMILKGVTIGADSVVAPKSVVTKSFPPRSVIAGIPACLLRQL